MDRLTPEQRSWLMSRVRAKDTSPELAVRRLIFSLGYRFRLHDKRLPGCPDIVFPARQAVIFVHGCFWHGHQKCHYGRLPKSRVPFWEAKISRNRSRDIENRHMLHCGGWQVLTVWQCELRMPAKLIVKIEKFLEKCHKHAR